MAVVTGDVRSRLHREMLKEGTLTLSYDNNPREPLLIFPGVPVFPLCFDVFGFYVFQIGRAHV